MRKYNEKGNALSFFREVITLSVLGLEAVTSSQSHGAEYKTLHSRKRGEARTSQGLKANKMASMKKGKQTVERRSQNSPKKKN